MGQIDDETAVRAVGDGSYATRLSANWCIGNNPNGGYAVQPVLRALADLTGRPDPTSVTVHYLRPALGDVDATITTAVVRAGRSGTNVTATLIQDDEPRLTVAAIMGDLATAVSDAPDPGLGVAAPVIPPPEECIDRAELGQGSSCRCCRASRCGSGATSRRTMPRRSTGGSGCVTAHRRRRRRWCCSPTPSRRPSTPRSRGSAGCRRWS